MENAEFPNSESSLSKNYFERRGASLKLRRDGEEGVGGKSENYRERKTSIRDGTGAGI